MIQISHKLEGFPYEFDRGVHLTVTRFAQIIEDLRNIRQILLLLICLKIGVGKTDVAI